MTFSDLSLRSNPTQTDAAKRAFEVSAEHAAFDVLRFSDLVMDRA